MKFPGPRGGDRLPGWSAKKMVSCETRAKATGDALLPLLLLLPDCRRLTSNAPLMVLVLVLPVEEPVMSTPEKGAAGSRGMTAPVVPLSTKLPHEMGVGASGSNTCAASSLKRASPELLPPPLSLLVLLLMLVLVLLLMLDLLEVLQL